jgi:predicted dehydrogenase
LTELDSEIAFVSSRKDLTQQTYSSIAQAVTEYSPEYVVISNPTSQHSETLQNLVATGFTGKVLVEKPANIDPAILPRLPFRSVHVAYNLRFHPLMSALKDALHGKKIISVQAYAGQDLNSWRPGRVVTEQYSAQAALGGGVLRDLSHELDYLEWLFGKITNVVALGGRLGDITVDADDTWSLLFVTEPDTQISLSLNYYDIPGSRSVRVVTEAATIFVDFSHGTMSINGEIQHQFSVGRNDTYLSMHSDVLGPGLTAAHLESYMNTDSLIRDIERSANDNKWVSR